MKQDAEVLVMLRERAKGRTQEQAATRAGMSVRTVREYERRAKLPSQLRQPRTYRSRPNPFVDDWPWITKLLEDDPALQGQTLFGLLCDRHFVPRLHSSTRSPRSGSSLTKPAVTKPETPDKVTPIGKRGPGWQLPRSTQPEAHPHDDYNIRSGTPRHGRGCARQHGARSMTRRVIVRT